MKGLYVTLVVIHSAVFAFAETPPADQLADLKTWLESKNIHEMSPAGGRLREVLKKEGAPGELLAQHILHLVETEKPRKNLSHLLWARAYSIDDAKNIIPHIDGSYLKDFARMSVPDDANHRYFHDHHAAVAYLKLHPEDHEIYWRLRLAATRDAKVGQMQSWSLRDETDLDRDKFQRYVRDHFPTPVRAYGPKDAWSILIQLKVLVPEMANEEAIKILGEPTSRTKDYIRWYLDTPRHVNPCLTAPIKDGKVLAFHITSA